ncbi:uncharacterized protein LOC124119526 isoform X1 [Haliotis rufescens]|uniref:uncharacterized protein LOC124119526 isoform X1 n=1 Tax=Haliotis rufescens TaxID=6454 RepID=UPI00201EEA32|nr:uncharacterized protein LOC124119526 isoform X1 [Haliotis rufescens]XP_048240930.1 uncharacterized protein LOC124119526 isoform X1 [Haliotis rufescens]XP_048240931.1 uncharacterized protein LOC124119526 isoform X1 [Haliotis rufescens]XP_048240932.1 uncharacterized protein LOC124119526 isoform X1 [Haliotis rufescens]
MAEMEKGQCDTESRGCTPENCRRKSNDEDNPPGTTDGSGSTIEAGRQRPRPQSYVPFPLEDSRQRPRPRPQRLFPFPYLLTKWELISHGLFSGDDIRQRSGIELSLRNSTVMFGDSATFRLRLRDDTEEAGEWTRDDVTLTHSDKTQISINGRGRQLTVTDVHPPDTGEYAYRVGEEMTSAHLSINEAYCFGSVQRPLPPVGNI